MELSKNDRFHFLGVNLGLLYLQFHSLHRETQSSILLLVVLVVVMVVMVVLVVVVVLLLLVVLIMRAEKGGVGKWELSPK